MPRWRFESTLVRPEGVGTWTFAPIPLDLAKQTGVKARMRVKGTMDGVPFKGTLLPAGAGNHFVVVNKELREEIGKEAGDGVRITMDLDTSPVTINIPKDFGRALESRPSARAQFERIAPSRRKAYVRWIEGAKAQETRSRRIARAVTMIARGERL